MSPESAIVHDCQLLNVDELAQLLGIKKATVVLTSWRKSVGLKDIKIGKAVRFRESDVRALIKRSEKAE